MTNVASSITHTYTSAGIYNVEISGVFPAIRIYDSEYENKAFKNMYGNDASFINATNMMDVAKTMNKKFLEK